MFRNKKIKKILIANRGEIAVRILRTCRELGISTVAIYSDCDREATHVQWADEAYPVGPSPASQSYLNIEKILEVAGKSKAQAVHPGYGFLSENKAFAEACEAEGLCFIGPAPETIRRMGNKLRAREIAKKLKLPLVPGLNHNVKSLKDAEKAAGTLGYPVMLKAQSGGGGKGLQFVNSPKEMSSAFQVARSEAQQSFKDSSLYIEKIINGARHIEIQIFGDRFGTVLAMDERDCSLQRRFQKIIEESPSPFLNNSTREKLLQAAVLIGKEVQYQSAGTVEFLVDSRSNIFFLEMNPRIQVEHPVTELKTDLDMIGIQIRVAEGFSLNEIIQEPIKPKGHAIEFRIYAEDPDNNFVPHPGKIERLRNPEGPGIRVDTAVFSGDEIPIFYDPMIAKLISWGPNRTSAMARMKRALKEYEIFGIKTNLPFLSTFLEHPNFISGKYDIQFVEKHMVKLKKASHRNNVEIAAIAALIHQEGKEILTRPGEKQGNPKVDNWKIIGRRESLR